MVAASKAKPPQVTGDVLRASGAMLLSHLATHPSAVPLGLTLPTRHPGDAEVFQTWRSASRATFPRY